MGGGNVTNDNKHAGKKRTPMISVDAGVGGLVVLGGAMAVTVLMVVVKTFLGKKTETKDVTNVKKDGKEFEYGCSCGDDDQRLHDQQSEPVHQDLCCNRCGRLKISIDDEGTQFRSGRNLVLDKLTPKSNDEGPTYDHQEIFVLSDDSTPETVASGDETGTLTEDSPDTLTSDQSYFQREKMDHGETLKLRDTAKVNGSFEEREETHRADKENDASTVLNKAAVNVRSTETKSALRKRQGTTVKKNEMLKDDGCTGTVGGDNTKGKKKLNKEAKEKSVAVSPDSSNNPVGLRIRIFFIVLLSIPFLVLFLTYTAEFYLDTRSSNVIPRMHKSH